MKSDKKPCLRSRACRTAWLCLAMAFAALPMKAASGMFPKMPGADVAYVFDSRKDGDDAEMAANALQGLVNQSSAEVYILRNGHQLEQLKESGKPFETVTPLPGEDSALRTLFQKYHEKVKRMFVYDSKKDYTWYLATMLAAQQEGIPVTEPIQQKLAVEFSWHGEVQDVRGRWKNRVEAYDWALTNLMPQCTKQVLFVIRHDMPVVDYAVAAKGFIFMLDYRSNAVETAEIQKICRTKGYGVGTSLMGYSGDELNAVVNPFGIGYVPGNRYANGSFWSSFTNKTYTQTAGVAVNAERNKIYASISWSDGDNLHFDQNPLFVFWHDKERGQIPVGTGLSPTLQELNSPLLDWYYAHATANDELFAGASGVQFIYGRSFKPIWAPAWRELSSRWVAGAGFVSGHRLHTGVAAVDDAVSIAKNEGEFYKQLAAAQPNAQAPVFRTFECIVEGFNHTGDGGYTRVKKQVDKINAEYPGRYVFLLPKDLTATVKKYYRMGR